MYKCYQHCIHVMYMNAVLPAADILEQMFKWDIPMSSKQNEVSNEQMCVNKLLSFSAGGMGNFPPHLQPNPIISTSQVNPSNLTQDLNPTVPPETFMQPDPPVSCKGNVEL